MQVKQPPQPAKRQRLGSNIDDDFFNDTILASSSKGKARAEQASNDDELAVLVVESSTPRTRAEAEDALRKSRFPSSSPPPIADFEEPQIEPMRRGVSKFDLHDDEWRMVEDELLETAKLFTRNLHIAEYERLKERIDEKKKEVEVARPVVVDAKLSVDGAMRKKAKAQEQRQQKALRDISAGQTEESEDKIGDRASSSKLRLSTSHRAVTSISSPRSNVTNAAQNSDSDDLDTPNPSEKRKNQSAAISTPGPAPALVRRPATLSQRRSPSPETKSTPPTFKKPTTPLPAPKTRARPSRATPFDMLDDYVPKKSITSTSHRPDACTPVASKPHVRSSSVTKSSPLQTTPSSAKPRRTPSAGDEWGGGVSKETADRLARRNAERDKEEKEQQKQKEKAATLEDIPTFFF